ncbi:hypothetical protein Ahy_B10g102411 [Arachis hypogaea]|uniref:Zinc knuckle CX2CX4HX4C domain-containing protein n=1 Tax=Arachis hypogaea TaxID=3818 RepID=A0A444X1P2_ARAHY|nr:hypothetical protein Ahy_B10g102411 [Arachis hypogaea]
MVKRWERDISPTDMKFTRAEVKLQLWNMPEHCKTIVLRKKIAAKDGKVKECSLFSAGPGKESFLKATVDMEITEPLRRGITMGSKFRYERLPTFCYACGVIGHDETNCGKWNRKRRTMMPNQEIGDHGSPWTQWEQKWILKEICQTTIIQR